MIAVVQFRTDESIEHEQKCFNKYLSGHDLEYLSIFDDDVSFDEPDKLLSNYEKLILAGSGEYLLSRGDDKTNFVYKRIKPLLNHILNRDFPTLGVCFGNQLMGVAMGGGIVNDRNQAEAGIQLIRFTDAGRKAEIFRDMHNPLSVSMGHEDSLVGLPISAVQLAYSDKCPLQAFRCGDNVYGVQFHVELDDEDLAERLDMYSQYDEYQLGFEATDGIHGPQVLKNFATI